MICSPHAYNYADVSERFEIASIGKIWEAPDGMYGRQHCFVIEYLGPQGARLVAMQALDESSKRTWMSSLLQSVSMLAGRTQVHAPLLLGSSQGLAASEGKPQEAPPLQRHQRPQDVAASSSEAQAQHGGTGASSTSSSSGKGRGKGPPLPSKGAKGLKGAGKGAPPVPPLPLGKGKGKAQPKASAKSLPFGKRLNMKDSGALPQTARGERGEQPSIFQGLFAKRAGQAQEDIETLRSLFSENKASASSSTGKGAPSLSPGTSATPRKIFPDAVARNCQIVLRGLPLRGQDLFEAVRLLEPGPLDQDQLERLAQMMPEPSLMIQLQVASEGPCPLRDAEQALVPFSQLGRLQERLKALTLAANLQPQELRLMGQMQAVREACAQMRESSSLKHILATVLVMYNYVNFGQVERAEARAFDIANLLHLNEFRADRGAPFPKFTALHYVAMRLLADESAKSVRTLQAELGRVAEAAGICLRYIGTSIEQLVEDIRKLREEQRANATLYGAVEAGLAVDTARGHMEANCVGSRVRMVRRAKKHKKAELTLS